MRIVVVALSVVLGWSCNAVGMCRGLLIDDIGGRLLAVCWSDEAPVLEAVNRQPFLGVSTGASGLLEQFARQRDQLGIRGVVALEAPAGFRYRLSHPAIVQGRSQYLFEITLPSRIEVTSIEGELKEVVDFVKARHPDAESVDIILNPISSKSIGGVNFHFAHWRLTRVTLEQYRGKG